MPERVPVPAGRFGNLAAMPSRFPEPLSPELILVAPPEEAELARKQLPAAPSEETRVRPTRVGAPREESAIANGRAAATSDEEQRAPEPGADSGASDWDD